MALANWHGASIKVLVQQIAFSNIKQMRLYMDMTAGCVLLVLEARQQHLRSAVHSSTFADTSVDIFPAVSTVREAEDHATLQASALQRFSAQPNLH